MKSQRRFAPKGDRNKPESVAGLAGISNSNLITISVASYTPLCMLNIYSEPFIYKQLRIVWVIFN